MCVCVCVCLCVCVCVCSVTMVTEVEYTTREAKHIKDEFIKEWNLIELVGNLCMTEFENVEWFEFLHIKGKLWKLTL